MNIFARPISRILVVLVMILAVIAQSATSSSGSSTLTTPLFHLYDAHTHDHFYTIKAAEEKSFVQNGAYVLEGIIGDAPVDATAHTASVYRLYNAATGEYFYTVSASEYISVATHLRYQEQGIGFQVMKTSGPGMLPLYRLYSQSEQRHFYTTNSSEYLSALQSGWSSEGILGYVSSLVPPAPTGLTAVGTWVADCPVCHMPMAHIVLTWQAVSGATSYDVYRSGVLLASGLTTPTYTDMAITSGQGYSYTVSALNASGAGPQCAPATATAPKPPAAATPMTMPVPPTNLAAHGVWQGGSTDTLTWDAVPGASSYNVYQYEKLIAQGVTKTTYTVPLNVYNVSMTYTVTTVNNGVESIPSAIASARGANDPSQQPSWMPGPPVAPTNVTATADWNTSVPRILLTWRGSSTDYGYNVYRDGVLVAKDLWRLVYIDNNVQPGSVHTYTVTGVNVPWTATSESAPSASVTATALKIAPNQPIQTVQITKVVSDDDSVLVSFNAVPGAVDYRVYVAGNPGSVKYSGGGLSIEENGLDPTLNNSLVVEAVDKLGPFQTMDGSMGPGAMPMAGMTTSSVNGQGDPSNIPNVIATSGPFPVTVQPFLLTGAQAFQDNFRGGESFTPSTDMDTAVASLSSSYFEINEVENSQWRIRTYGADTDASKIFVMGNHFMDTLYDGPTAATSSFSHNNNASMVMMPKATADISGGKVLHVTFEVDGHFDSRRWCDVFVAPAGDSLLVPGKFFENNQNPDTSGNMFRWEIHSQTCDAQVFQGMNSSGILNDTELFDLANGVGADDFGPGVRTTWDGNPVLNGTYQDLDKRHRFDLYLSQTHFRVEETVLGAAPVIIKDETFPNGVTLPFTKCQVYFVHQLYHTANDRNENVDYGYASSAYWYNNRPWADERHWDDMGYEVLPSFPQ
jgi:hypothetical protein